jgi:hypothetical protein
MILFLNLQNQMQGGEEAESDDDDDDDEGMLCEYILQKRLFFFSICLNL